METQKIHVVTMAHSVPMYAEIHRIIDQEDYIETSIELADFVLVVCRSMEVSPLLVIYRSIEELNWDVESHANTAGVNFHVYLYSISSLGRLTEIAHESLLHQIQQCLRRPSADLQDRSRY